jgi:hypothetical protein
MVGLARSQTTTTTTSLSAGAVGGCGGNILDAANSHTATSQSPESRLGARAGGLGAVTTGSTDLHVKSVDTQILATLGDL